MKALVKSGKKEYTIDLSKPLDISISLTNGPANLTAWYQEPPEIKAVEMEGFVGDVQRGGSVNFRNVFFNPHAHGTHTECVGHISAEGESVNAALSQFFFTAQLISIPPQVLDNGDHCLTLAQVKEQLPEAMPTAIVVRTLPNNETKTSRQYSRTNPAYVAAEVMQFLVDKGVQHFLIDLPSVDREEDEGELKAHKDILGI
jgi:arylformamidase